jgi:hypothetical protein
VERVVTAGMRGVPAFAAFAILTFPAPPARAGEPQAALWTIEAQPWPCARFVADLARDVELACDASGGACHVAAAEDPPTLQAVLGCTADTSKPWTLSATTMKGEELWTLTLDGDQEERLRKGALWIARTPAPLPPAPPVIHTAPAPFVAPRDEPRAPPPESDVPEPEQGGLSLEAFFTAGTGGTHGTGVRGAGFFHGTGATRRGFSLSVASDSTSYTSNPVPLFSNALGPTTSGTTTSSRSGWFAQAGAIFIAGAPWTDSVAGFALESGLAAGTRSGLNSTAICTQQSDFGGCARSYATSSWTTESFVTPYAAGTFILQVPSHLPLNLFTSATSTVYPFFYRNAQLFFTFSVGVSWRAW